MKIKLKQLPGYVPWLLGFQVCNAFTFTIALGYPMVLTARFLGAREAAVGALLSLTPFLALLQMFSTGVAEKWGYRRLILTGWTARSFMLLLVVPLPFFADTLPPSVLVTALFIPLFGFNFIRGLSACAWFPWLRVLIPEKNRGYFLGLEQQAINISVLFTLLLASLMLAGRPEGWRYGMIYGMAWMGGLLSVWVLSHAPDIRSPESSRRPPHRFSRMWPVIQSIFRHKPFRRVVRLSIGFMTIQASIPGFLALFMRDELGWSDSKVLLIGACITIGVIFTASLWGRLSDMAGSRPLMRLATFCQLIPLSYWALCAGGLASPDPVAFGLVNVIFGIFLGAQTVAMIRLSLWGCPDDETTVGMMTYQVLVSLTGGISVLTWGFILRGLRGVFPPMLEAGYSGTFLVFFLFAIFVLIILQLFIGRVPETRAITSKALLVQMLWGFPLRVLSGFVPGQDRDSEK